jgi:Family of unknown function (DUF5407)
MMAGVQALRYIPHPVPQRAIREFLLSSVGIAAVCLAFCSQPSVANGAGSTASQARGFPFNAVAEDALVVKKLLAVENLIVADGARAIPTTDPLARRIEQRDELMEKLCTGIIHDAVIVARAEKRARRAHITQQSGGGLSAAELFEVINRATLDVKKKINAITRDQEISVADMFEMQMLMNHFSQLSEMATSVVSAANSAIQSMARNVKS